MPRQNFRSRTLSDLGTKQGMVSAPQNDASLPARPKTMDDTSAPDVTCAAVTRPGNVDACRHGTTGTHERRSISGETVPQARIDSAHGRFPEAIAGLTKIVEFYDGRGMAVAPLVRALNFRAEAQLGKSDADAAMADARRALEISRRLQGDKPWSSLTGQSLLTIARIQENRGDHEAARVAAKEALPHLRETLSPEHPDARRAAQFSAD